MEPAFGTYPESYEFRPQLLTLILIYVYVL